MHSEFIRGAFFVPNSSIGSEVITAFYPPRSGGYILLRDITPLLLLKRRIVFPLLKSNELLKIVEDSHMCGCPPFLVHLLFRQYCSLTPAMRMLKVGGRFAICHILSTFAQ